VPCGVEDITERTRQVVVVVNDQDLSLHPRVRSARYDYDKTIVPVANNNLSCYLFPICDRGN
jgi:hypothetical protein